MQNRVVNETEDAGFTRGWRASNSVYLNFTQNGKNRGRKRIASSINDIQSFIYKEISWLSRRMLHPEIRSGRSIGFSYRQNATGYAPLAVLVTPSFVQSIKMMDTNFYFCSRCRWQTTSRRIWLWKLRDIADSVATLNTSKICLRRATRTVVTLVTRPDRSLFREWMIRGTNDYNMSFPKVKMIKYIYCNFRSCQFEGLSSFIKICASVVRNILRDGEMKNS